MFAAPPCLLPLRLGSHLDGEGGLDFLGEAAAVTSASGKPSYYRLANHALLFFVLYESLGQKAQQMDEGRITVRMQALGWRRIDEDGIIQG